jgi:hypothetical protein
MNDKLKCGSENVCFVSIKYGSVLFELLQTQANTAVRRQLRRLRARNTLLLAKPWPHGKLGSGVELPPFHLTQPGDTGFTGGGGDTF